MNVLNPPSGVMQVSTGEFHTVYLYEDGTVWTAGSNFLANGDGTSTDRSNPVRVPDPLGRVRRGSSLRVSVKRSVLKADGTVWASGRNVWGQLGDGTIWIDRIPFKS